MRTQSKRTSNQDRTLTAKLGDMIPNLTIAVLPDAKPDAVSLAPAVEQLKVVISSWKRKIRMAQKLACEKADRDAENAENETKAKETARRSEREILESRAQVLAELATTLKERSGWVWKDEIEHLLEPQERAFLGEEIQADGEWGGGFWRGDWEIRNSRNGQSRRMVDYELIDSIAARKMFELEATVEAFPKQSVQVVEEFRKEFEIGRKRTLKIDDEEG